MKRIKKVLASLMVVVMVLTAAPLSGFVGMKLNLDWLNFDWLDFNTKASAESYSGNCGDNLTWALEEETGELIISGTGEMKDYSTKYSNGSFITTAPWGSYVSSIRSVTIQNGATSIGFSAFYGCTSLTSITIPDSVTSIGSSAFNNTGYYNNSSNWEDSVLYIGNHLIKANTSLSGVYTIKEGTKCVASSTFSSCTSLTSITIPDSVTSIGSSAFSNCTSLTSVTADENNNTYSSDENGVLFNKDKTELVQYPIGNERTSYTIPDSVTSIGSSAFSYCTSLKSITIPDSVTSIGDSAFSNCESLTSVTIPDGVTSISSYAFYNCESLTSITIPDSVTSIGKYAFNGCNTAKVYYTGTKDKWSSITFGSSIGLNTIVFECNSERPYYDFGKCGDNLDWILYSDDELVISGTGVMESYESTLYVPWYSYQSSIKKVTIGNGVTSIGGRAFYGCTSLTSITIPDSVTSIGPSAFYNTGYYNDSSNWEDDVLYIGNHLIEAETSLSGAYTVKEGTKCIGDSAFSNCTSLTSITIPDSVASIGNYAFRECTSLTSITIPDSVTSISHGVFNGCTSLTSITIPDSVTSIGNSAFSGCTSLTNITIPDGVTSIGDNAFSDCEKLEKVIFKRSDYIELGTDFLVHSPNAMICCEEGSYLHAYTEVNNMKVCIFDENGVPSFVVQNDVLLSYRGESKDVFVSAGTKIGYGAFENNSVIETVVLSSSVSRIYGNAFKNCSSLKTVIIPESVTSIAAGAFDGSDDLTIWCYAGSYADSYATANGIDVEYIALDIEKDILILTLGESSSLTASLNTPYAENSGIVWSSTNTSIATVDGNGNVKGIKAGTAVIVATSKDGGLRDYCVVKVVGIEALSTATIDHENGIIMGLSSNLDSLDGYVEISDPACNLSYDSLGTDSVVYVECDGEIIDAYSVIIFGDVNGDSWYDGQDAVLVSCLANGMLTKDDVSEAVYMAADCNHDGVIDQLDVEILNQAGTLLANVDQSKPAEVLLETSAEYVEYLDLIDQSPEIEIEDETDIPEVDVEDTPEADTEDAKVDIFEMIMNFIKSIFEMLLSYIPMPM